MNLALRAFINHLSTQATSAIKRSRRGFYAMNAMLFINQRSHQRSRYESDYGVLCRL
ncbi:uncharacterized protein CPUR_01074 [Claviceps purpurea 20.1]|uniref:Uncharacterized protein n=1 Tax=Claviceps purpurea (strain 20.1) TaxID=1111077 RepID=M1W2G8_CLAP2|nr:uncharacterized protein CPUR_01074 [Claviceps purpurea 20.1]